ncbi:hypothetical protein JXB12_01660 [candidate division KSB1 bacterium]|nr:hypothetical protein [candidate division KSB1 bacterium]
MIAFHLVLASPICPAEHDTDNADLLTQARDQFYESLEDESKIDDAIYFFEELAKTESLEGKALTYIGALYAIRGKHVFSPFAKMKWVNKGLSIMDKGLQSSPEDIEALFIHGSTCYYLPFFFNRKHQAKEHFQTIIQLLPTHYSSYEPRLILNMIEFLESKINLTTEETVQITEIKKELRGD